MTPQPGIFSLGAESHLYLEFDIRTGDQAGGRVSHPGRLLGPDRALVATSAVVGVRPELWASVAGERGPSEDRSFEQVGEGEAAMPATQHDAWVWLAAARRELVYDAGRAVLRVRAPVAVLATEVAGRSDHAHLDLTGFVDGTENPSALEAPSVAVGSSGPGAGSGVLRVQQWRHDDSVVGLPVVDQERVIGRTRVDDEELSEEAMPPGAHVARMAIEEVVEGGGAPKLAIYRRNTARGGRRSHGTMCVGAAATPHPLQRMLERMAGVSDGVRDPLSRYATPLTGAYYVVPARDALAGLLG